MSRRATDRQPGRDLRNGMSRRGPAAAVAALVAGVAAVAAVIALASDATRERPEEAGAARRAASRFLAGFMAPDGRVVRRDQGGDTVSEGQAYAMLLAVAVGDRRRFELAWRWSRRHLQRPDGLMSWRWAGGGVADREAAADADLDMARALTAAARRFRAPAYRRAAARLARAVLEHETARARGRLVLAAGPWARDGRVVNPSYWSPRAFQELAAVTGDRRWRDLAATARRMLGQLIAGGSLPPDWARVGPDGTARAVPAPSGGEAVYGYDAVRVPLRFAEACDARSRRLAAAVWRRLPRGAAAGPAPVLSLDGRPRAPGRHPAALVGAAAAAHVAGDRAAARRLLAGAEALDRRKSTYYGSALVALGRVMLATRWLGACP